MSKLLLLLLSIAQLSAVEVFLHPPQDFQPSVAVAGVFVECGDEFLFLQTREDKHHAGKWGAPAGKVEPGETPKQAAIRETYEETGLNVSGCLHFLKTFYIRSDIDFTCHCYQAKLQSKPTITISEEHTAYRWATLKEALTMPLIPGEARCIEILFCTPAI